MSAYEDTVLAARFSALAPEPLAGDWQDIIDRAGRARKRRGWFATSLQSRRRRQLVVLAAVALVVVVGAASALAVRAFVFQQGIVGLPPAGAAPSTPKKGELVLHFVFGHSMGDHGRFAVFVYADGRLITERIGDYSLAPTDEHRKSTGLLERRLTPEGVERVRAEVISTGLFDRDLHLTSGRGLTYGYVGVPTGDGLVQVIWGDITWEGVDPDAPREFPTPEQANALIRLDERLADPTSWLPASAWADRQLKQYVAPGYSVCYQGPRGLGQSQVLALLPPAAQDFLRIRDTRQEEYTNLAGRFVYWCSDLTNDESRALARILDSAGLKGHEDVFGLTYGAYQREIGGPPDFWLNFEPLSPHRQ